MHIKIKRGQRAESERRESGRMGKQEGPALPARPREFDAARKTDAIELHTHKRPNEPSRRQDDYDHKRGNAQGQKRSRRRT